MEQLKAMGINDLLGFDFMDPPPVATLISAMQVSERGGTGEEGVDGGRRKRWLTKPPMMMGIKNGGLKHPKLHTNTTLIPTAHTHPLTPTHPRHTIIRRRRRRQ